MSTWCAARPNAKAEPPPPLCSSFHPTPPTQAKTRALRAEYSSKARETTKTHKAAETEWQHKVNREKNAGVFKLRAATQEPRGAAAGCGVAARRQSGHGHDGHARARSRVHPVSVQVQAILEAFAA